MTGSFSDLVPAGLSLRPSKEIEKSLNTICERADNQPLYPWAREASLKILEMTRGRVAVLAETYLGLRHGPISVIDSETIVLCLMSMARFRSYEADLIDELHVKKLGTLVGIAPTSCCESSFEFCFEPLAEELPDCLRTPFEIVIAQLIAYQLSLQFASIQTAPVLAE